MMTMIVAMGVTGIGGTVVGVLEVQGVLVVVGIVSNVVNQAILLVSAHLVMEEGMEDMVGGMIEGVVGTVMDLTVVGTVMAAVGVIAAVGILEMIGTTVTVLGPTSVLDLLVKFC